jgi:hypothetical protein
MAHALLASSVMDWESSIPEEPAAKIRRRARRALGIVAMATLPIALVAAIGGLRSASETAQAIAADRASYAIGISAGAGLRGVARVSLDDLRRGLIDGLAESGRQTGIMSRAELFSRLREVTKRLSDSELEAISARIDRSQDS